MKRTIFFAIIFLAIFALILTPVLVAPSPVYAAEQAAQGEGFFSNLCTQTGKGAPDCTFRDLVNLGGRIINFLLIISIPIAAICFAIAGFLFVTAAGSESQISKARGIFTKVAVGFIIILAAWLIVKTITVALFSTEKGAAPPQLLTKHIDIARHT